MIFLYLLLLPYVYGFPEAGHFTFESSENSKSHFVGKSIFKNSFIDVEIMCQNSGRFKILIQAIAKDCFVKDLSYGISSDTNIATIEMIRTCEENRAINLAPSNVTSLLFAASSDKHFLTTAQDAIYGLKFQIVSASNNRKTTPFRFINVSITVDITASYGYLSAAEFPLLLFYSVMSGIYSILALIWIIVCCRNWRDLLRIQFCIGVVILLGMLEKAFYVSEYHSINVTGEPLKYPILIAEIVSCVKRTLARVLIMVVCIGYGIVKPRLGPALRKILGVGCAYLLTALIESAIRVLRPDLIHSKYIFLPDLALVIVDTLILWWSFSYLIHTIKQMRMRRNVVKFNLYRHFSNVLIIVVVASVVFMVWALYTFKSTKCNKHWKLIWANEAYWHILFSIVLMTIMVLWRPSRNNQRYAYSPLLDSEEMAGDDDEEDNAGAGGINMNSMNHSDDEDVESKSEIKRNKKSRNKDNGSNVIHDNMTVGQLRKDGGGGAANGGQQKVNTAEDDLKWIEENIPTSAAEKFYPLLDSDEEITPSKISSGKMD